MGIRDIPKGENHGGIPFREPLVDISNGKVFELPSAPDKVVRRLRINAGDANTAIAMAVEGKKLFCELDERYGVRVPRMEFVIGRHGERPDSDALYTIADKVEGEQLSHLSPENMAALQDKIEDALVSFAAYYRDKYNQGGTYLNDPNPFFQMRYGRTQGEPRDSLYFIDVDPYYSSVDRHRPDDGENNDFVQAVEEVFEAIQRVERIIHRPLVRAREALLAFTENVPPEKTLLSRGLHEVSIMALYPERRSPAR